jgi:hypothetical protein
LPEVIADQAVRSHDPSRRRDVALSVRGTHHAAGHAGSAVSGRAPRCRAGTLLGMAPITPARALLLLVGGLTCLMTAGGALVGVLFGGVRGALVTAVCAGAAGLAGSLLARRRALAHFAAARRQAGARGYAEGIAHGVLVHVAAYEAAVFPCTGPAGVTLQERAARRTVAYRMAALDEVPHPVREAAADALAVLDEADRSAAEEAMARLATLVRQEYARP